VLGENEFRVKEESGFGDPQLDDNLQKDQLDRNGMMDTIIRVVGRSVGERAFPTRPFLNGAPNESIRETQEIVGKETE
jgi:hypothetical protein